MRQLPDADTVLASLTQLRAQLLDALRQVDGLAASVQPFATSVRDRTLIALLARVTRGAVFSAADLKAHAAVNQELQDALGDISIKSLGHRLAALAGRPLGDFRLVRQQRDERGCIWFVELHGDAGDAGGR